MTGLTPCSKGRRALSLDIGIDAEAEAWSDPARSADAEFDIGNALLRIDDVAGDGGRGADTARPSLASSDDGLAVES